MRQLEVFNKIGGILKELNDQYQYIKKTPENINDLEMELFVANAHFLTDHAEILNKLNQRTNAEEADETRADKVGTKADSELLPPHAPEEIAERNFELPVRPVEPPKLAEQPIPEPVRFTESTRPVEPPEPAEQPRPEAVRFIEASKQVEQPKPEPIRAVEPPEPEEPVRAVITPEKFFEPLVQQPKPRRIEPAETEASTPQIDLSSDTPSDSYSFIRETPEVIRHELEIDPADMVEDSEEDEITPAEEAAETTPEPVKVEAPKLETKEEPKPGVRQEPKPIERKEEPAKEKEEILTIHQRMSAQRSAAAGYTEQAAQPVTNLKAAITLNDKLVFIKDLFNGYSLAYSEAIEILNRFNSFEEANRFLSKNYTVKNNWESKPETAERFYGILRRRYS